MNKLRPAPWYSPRIPTYWFCSAIAFGLIALIPVWTITTPNIPRPHRAILATAYLPPHRLPWRETLVAHTAAATIVAAAATIIIHCASTKDRVARTFGIKTLLAVMLAAALAAALLRHFAVHPLVLVCVLIPIIAHPIACYVAITLRGT
jgi:hypothetical protein